MIQSPINTKPELPKMNPSHFDIEARGKYDSSSNVKELAVLRSLVADSLYIGRHITRLVTSYASQAAFEGSFLQLQHCNALNTILNHVRNQAATWIHASYDISSLGLKQGRSL